MSFTAIELSDSSTSSSSLTSASHSSVSPFSRFGRFAPSSSHTADEEFVTLETPSDSAADDVDSHTTSSSSLSNSRSTISRYEPLNRNLTVLQSSIRHCEWSRWIVPAAALLALLVAFLVGFFSGASAASSNSSSSSDPQHSPSSSSSPLFMFSFDGFRNEYLTQYLTELPNFQRLFSRGFRVSNGIQPVFPSYTFPNHFSLATGLYPESHGIVGNTMRDGDKSFSLSNAQAIRDPFWWNAEPIWITAEKMKIPTGVLFWPGNEVLFQGKYMPNKWIPFDDTMTNDKRLDRVLEWFDAGQCRLCMAYFSDTDSTGHHFGPETPQAKAAVLRIDAIIGRLLDELDRRGISQSAHVLIVSDHGMASTQNTIFIDDLVSRDIFTVVDTGPTSQLIPVAPTTADELYNQLSSAIAGLNPPTLAVYRRGELPNEFHFASNKRIHEIILLANETYYITTHDHPNHYIGGHGFDPRKPEMKAILTGMSPKLQRNSLIQADSSDQSSSQSIANLNVYPLACWLLGISPQPNNGTIDPFLPYLV